MQIQANMKMADIIHLNYHLLPIISRFGIKPGFGEKNILQICNHYNINVDFFLEIVNSFHVKNYFPKKHLQSFSIKLIVDYLRKSHEYYRNIKIPQIALLLNQFSKCSDQSMIETFKLIDEFFIQYINEFNIHLKREEEKVYPYVFKIENAFLNKNVSPEITALINSYSMHEYENEHDNIEDKLLDLKNILIKYIPGDVDFNLFQTILFELFRLETDLRDHARLEDRILVPKVKYMEKWIIEHS